uniref:TPR domain protein n=1 Tax=Rheinheimera sp. BAL341 TaxID=1708203 RepID=A0A486XIT4_9GAMM
MNIYKIIIILLVTGSVGCQSTLTSVPPPSEELWLAEQSFDGQLSDIPSTEEIFSLSEHTKQQLRYITSMKSIMPERTKAVLNYILKLADSELIYQLSATTTAQESMLNGNANCLSLAILTYSIASELGLKAEFQDIQIPEYWTSQNNTTWLNGHINLRIKQSMIADTASSAISIGTDIVVDFDPFVLKKQFPSTIVKKDRVVAMFYNNKAAEAFADNNIAQAYRYYKASANADPRFAVTWSNLAILYRHIGHYETAEMAYNYSLQLDPTSLNTLANLAFLYQHTGKTEQARLLQQQVDGKRRRNPYYFVMLGDEALRAGVYSVARSKYLQAVRLDNKTHEAYFGLAQIHFAQNENDEAAYYLRKAKRNTPSESEQKRYQNKLDVLHQVARSH